jgi:hypothetical protein
LLIGCAGSVILTFAGTFRIQPARTNRFDTNMTPTCSLLTGVPREAQKRPTLGDENRITTAFGWALAS